MRNTSGQLLSGLTVTVNLSKDGAAFASPGTATEIGSSGIYSYPFSGLNFTADDVCGYATAPGAVPFVFGAYTAESTWDEGVDVKSLAAAAVNADLDVYTMIFNAVVNSGGSNIGYAAVFHKNGVPVAAGVPGAVNIKLVNPVTNVLELSDTLAERSSNGTVSYWLVDGTEFTVGQPIIVLVTTDNIGNFQDIISRDS